MTQSIHRGLAAATFLVSTALAQTALAETKIGGAEIIRNDVRGETTAGTRKIAAGDDVVADERVRTGADSMTRIVLLDDTNVSLGPSSQLKLDRFVFDPDRGAGAVALSAARGAFRFFSGRSPHDAYSVETPQASIAVRGTVYDVRVASGTTRVVLREGAVRVCVLGTSNCVDLDRPGEAVEVRNRRIEGPLPAGRGWNFGSLCGDRGLETLCGRTTFAAFEPRTLPFSPPVARPTRAAAITPPPPRATGPRRPVRQAPRRIPARTGGPPPPDDGEFAPPSPLPGILLGIGGFGFGRGGVGGPSRPPIRMPQR